MVGITAGMGRGRSGGAEHVSFAITLSSCAPRYLRVLLVIRRRIVQLLVCPSCGWRVRSGGAEAAERDRIAAGPGSGTRVGPLWR